MIAVLAFVGGVLLGAWGVAALRLRRAERDLEAARRESRELAAGIRRAERARRRAERRLGWTSI